jgi:signal transduction histidine kinase
LGVLQYRWTGAISDAERQRLEASLHDRLLALQRSFNQRVSVACSDLLPNSDEVETAGREAAYSAAYLRWKTTHEALFRRIALAVPESGLLNLSLLDLDTGRFSPSSWPPAWTPMHETLQQRLRGEPVPPAGLSADPVLLEFPRFGPPPSDRRSPEQEWMIVELDTAHLLRQTLPEYLNRYLADAGHLDYDAEVVVASDPSKVLYQSGRVGGREDASVSLLSLGVPGRAGRFGRGREGPPKGPPGIRELPMLPGATGPPGVWLLRVRHQAGSLEALVAQTRRRNLAVSGGLLLLILATALMMARLSRRTQRLADLQMNFVAGVSHELRTPLSVIHTAGFNLEGKLANDPDQVRKYGALIQRESGKLGALVEQILRFAGARAGQVLRKREPLAIDDLIQASLPADQETSHVAFEKRIAPGLPPVLADEEALTHAIRNLIDNAVKYGATANPWVGISAAPVSGNGGPAVEISVADRGPGIPADERKHIFDAFYRGKRAQNEQVHGTGLGLNLVKRIVEAHGGAIRVESDPSCGTTFIVRLPAAQNEFTHPAG